MTTFKEDDEVLVHATAVRGCIRDVGGRVLQVSGDHVKVAIIGEFRSVVVRSDHVIHLPKKEEKPNSPLRDHMLARMDDPRVKGWQRYVDYCIGKPVGFPLPTSKNSEPVTFPMDLTECLESMGRWSGTNEPPDMAIKKSGTTIDYLACLHRGADVRASLASVVVVKNRSDSYLDATPQLAPQEEETDWEEVEERLAEFLTTWFDDEGVDLTAHSFNRTTKEIDLYLDVTPQMAALPAWGEFKAKLDAAVIDCTIKWHESGEPPVPVTKVDRPKTGFYQVCATQEGTKGLRPGDVFRRVGDTSFYYMDEQLRVRSWAEEICPKPPSSYPVQRFRKHPELKRGESAAGQIYINIHGTSLDESYALHLIKDRIFSFRAVMFLRLKHGDRYCELNRDGANVFQIRGDDVVWASTGTLYKKAVDAGGESPYIWKLVSPASAESPMPLFKVHCSRRIDEDSSLPRGKINEILVG